MKRFQVRPRPTKIHKTRMGNAIRNGRTRFLDRIENKIPMIPVDKNDDPLGFKNNMILTRMMAR